MKINEIKYTVSVSMSKPKFTNGTIKTILAESGNDTFILERQFETIGKDKPLYYKTEIIKRIPKH